MQERSHHARSLRPPTQVDELVKSLPFSFGPEREDYERRLPPGVQDTVAAELIDYPGSYRHFLKERVYDELLANGAIDVDAVALRERVRAIVKAIRAGGRACSTGS